MLGVTMNNKNTDGISQLSIMIVLRLILESEANEMMMMKIVAVRTIPLFIQAIIQVLISNIGRGSYWLTFTITWPVKQWRPHNTVVIITRSAKIWTI